MDPSIVLKPRQRQRRVLMTTPRPKEVARPRKAPRRTSEKAIEKSERMMQRNFCMTA